MLDGIAANLLQKMTRRREAQAQSLVQAALAADTMEIAR